MKPIKWKFINEQNLPIESGIYAWYYKLIIGKKDIDTLISQLNNQSDIDTKKNIVSDFITKHIFNYFKEEPYSVSLHGTLKPKYEGNIHHVNTVSESIVDKVVEKPTSIYEIKEIFESISAEFSSPLYIGMTKNLSSRVNVHKKLIENYKVNGVIINDEHDLSDQNFAARVVSKKLIETNLEVIIKPVASRDSLNNLLENILNRINYPVMGRN